MGEYGINKYLQYCMLTPEITALAETALNKAHIHDFRLIRGSPRSTFDGLGLAERTVTSIMTNVEKWSKMINYKRQLAAE